MTSDVAPEARIPNPRLAALAPFVGLWTTVGEHAMIPNTTLHGRSELAWHDGGAFLCLRTEIDEPKVPSAICLIGSDDAGGRLTMLYFDERAVSRRFEVELDGAQLAWSRTAPGFSQRYVLTLAPDGRTMRGVSTMSKDGTTWEQDMTLTYTRA